MQQINAFQLLEKLSDFYMEDIEKHAILCKAYPQIAHKYVQLLEKSIKDVQIPHEIDMEETKTKIWQRLQDKIRSESE